MGIIKEVLEKAGITVNGKKPYDIQVKDKRFYKKVLAQGNLGLGESYMDGWWECKQLDEFFNRILKQKPTVKTWKALWEVIQARILNMQSKMRSKKVAQKHYDLDTELYTYMLDKHMQYTCGYWKNAKTLDKAQEDKLELVCKKLKLRPGMTVLELGGGFGGLSYYMAKKYKCKVTMYNISKEQVAYARKKCKGLPVEIIQADYRTATGTYDRVVSIGMCEHVGPKNHRAFIKLAKRRMKKEGLFLLHTIGRNTNALTLDPWINKYIFPGGVIPSIEQLAKASQGIFVMEDWHNFGANYDNTLMAWHDNFEKNWDKLKHKYDERFYRMWVYYLLSCAGAFRARELQLWQIVFSTGMPGGYKRET